MIVEAHVMSQLVYDRVADLSSDLRTAVAMPHNWAAEEPNAVREPNVSGTPLGERYAFVKAEEVVSGSRCNT